MSGPLNTEYFAKLTEQVNAVNTCAELQALTDEIFSTLNEMKAAVASQVEALAALQGLLSIPTDPSALLTWVSDFITLYLGPQLAAYAKYTAKQTELLAQITALTAAITAKAASFVDCTITIPP